LVVPDRGGPGVEPAEAGKMEITASHRALFRLPLPVMGWSPDEKTLYVEKTTRAGQATISVELLGYDMYSGARRSLGKFRGETYLDLSPDGKWIAVNAERDVRGFKWLGTLPVSLTLLNRSTGARHVFPKWSAQDWAPGGRYLWCKAFTLKPPSETAHVVDLHSLREVATIGRKQLRGAVPYEEQFSPRGDWVLINVYGPQAIPPEGWYDIVVARANGTGVRSLKPFGIVPWGNSRFLGWTWDGDLLTWLQKERKLVRLNPQTGARKVIYPPGG
jgi:hypothetical protein